MGIFKFTNTCMVSNDPVETNVLHCILELTAYVTDPTSIYHGMQNQKVSECVAIRCDRSVEPVFSRKGKACRRGQFNICMLS